MEAPITYLWSRWPNAVYFHRLRSERFGHGVAKCGRVISVNWRKDSFNRPTFSDTLLEPCRDCFPDGDA